MANGGFGTGRETSAWLGPSFPTRQWVADAATDDADVAAGLDAGAGWRPDAFVFTELADDLPP